MPSGFFLGGAASGFNEADRNNTRLQELADARQRVIRQEAQKSAAGLLSLALKTVDAGKKAGQSSDAINRAVQPFMDSIATTYGKIGQDPAPLVSGVQNLIDIPAPLGKPEKPLTELGRLHDDLENGRITQNEFTARINRLTEPTRQPNTVETIRGKIAAGQSLTPGERQVYDDALKANPLSRLLIGMQNGGADSAFGAPSGPGPVSPAVPAPSASPPANGNVTSSGVPWSFGQ